MAVTPDRPGPYAPISTVLDVVTRFRDRGLPAPITKDVLSRAGIAETLVPRVLQTITTLDLVNEEGQPTAVFEGIRRAPEAEYRQRVKEWLDAAYAEVLNYVDPATASEIEVRDAFRNYNPIGQQARMVALFLGLYGHAGIGAVERQQPQPRIATPRASAPRRAQNAVRPAANTRSARVTTPQTSSELPPALAGLMASIPKDGRGWTEETRKRFLTTFESVLDFCVPVVTTEDADAVEEEAA
jgi:hypothetical protein